jgi:hypothetical protein
MTDKIGDEAIEVMVARTAIAEVLYGYARGIRNGDVSTCVEMFTHDAVFEVRDAAPAEAAGYRVRHILRGREEIRAYLQYGAAASVKAYPLIHNLMIEVNGLEAFSNCMMTAWVLPVGRQVLGEYEDRYRWEQGWRFVSRIYTILGPSGPALDSAKPPDRTSNQR